MIKDLRLFLTEDFFKNLKKTGTLNLRFLDMEKKVLDNLLKDKFQTDDRKNLIEKFILKVKDLFFKNEPKYSNGNFYEIDDFCDSFLDCYDINKKETIFLNCVERYIDYLKREGEYYEDFIVKDNNFYIRKSGIFEIVNNFLYEQNLNISKIEKKIKR